MQYGQPRLHSLVESVVNISAGFVVAVIVNYLLLPLFGMHPTLKDSMWIAVIFTFIGIARSYLVRRLFNHWHLRRLT